MNVYFELFWLVRGVGGVHYPVVHTGAPQVQVVLTLTQHYCTHCTAVVPRRYM
jgi:hypothetical protein